jgi:hypothetical protein
MYDGEEGEFAIWIDSVGEVNVQWTWCEGDDWECDGEFDVFVFAWTPLLCTLLFGLKETISFTFALAIKITLDSSFPVNWLFD